MTFIFCEWAALLTLRSRSAARQAPGRRNHADSVNAAIESISTLIPGLEENRGEALPESASIAANGDGMRTSIGPITSLTASPPALR